jgi:peptide/nickel transport system substrate-binding protein
MDDQWSGSFWRQVATGRISRRRALRAGAAASGFVALGLAGCGGSNNSKSTDSNSNTAAAPSVTSAAAPSGTSAAASATAAATATNGASAAPQTVPTAPTSLKTGGTIQGVTVGTHPLDPVAITTYRAQWAAGFHYARLFRFAAGDDPSITLNRTPVPDLVEKYESTSDGMQYTMHLRQGVMFHPPLNRALTSADVLASYQYFTTNTKNTNAHVYDPIVDSLTAPDDNTLVWKLKLPYAPFLNKLANTQYLWIMSKDGIDGKFDLSQQAIGVGPWILDNSGPTAISWKKNPNYWNKGLPLADGAVLNIIPDTSTQEAQFGAGKIDVYGAPAADVDDLKKSNPRATVVEYVPLGMAFLFFYNVMAPDSVFKDPRVRQAASLAIDRQGIIDAIYSGKGVFVNVVPPGLGKWSLDPLGKEIGEPGKWFKHDPQAAKQMLTAAGAADTEFKFYYPNNAYGDTFNATAEAARGMLADAGFKIQPVTVDYLKDWIEATHGLFCADNLPKDGIGHGLQTPFTDPDDWLTGQFTKDGNRNHSRVDDPDLAALIKKQQVELDPTKRLQEVYDAQRAADDKMYIVPLHYTKAYSMRQPWVQNYWTVDDYDFATESWAYASVNNK